MSWNVSLRDVFVYTHGYVKTNCNNCSHPPFLSSVLILIQLNRTTFLLGRTPILKFRRLYSQSLEWEGRQPQSRYNTVLVVVFSPATQTLRSRWIECTRPLSGHSQGIVTDIRYADASIRSSRRKLVRVVILRTWTWTRATAVLVVSSARPPLEAGFQFGRISVTPASQYSWIPPAAGCSLSNALVLASGAGGRGRALDFLGQGFLLFVLAGWR